MLPRLVQLAIRSYVKGPARSWLYTSIAMWGLRRIQRTVGRRELIDVSSIKPGQKIVIENLDVSHRRQMRDFKRSARAEKRATKQAQKAGRRWLRGTR